MSDSIKRPACLIEIVIDEAAPARRSADAEHERRVAIYDLLEENQFVPQGAPDGPYVMRLSLVETRLMFDIKSAASGETLSKLALPLLPFRRIMKDYALVCETYYEAIKTAPRSRIVAIDMGRRSLHNEGAELLQEKLRQQIELDFDTARGLFTLLYVMQMRG
ncbi:MAG: UPF0262 family protein [Alphaproteobacteria bacterium]|nr:UPF0262 family protein [Alphaproteobacteria bacterium]